MTKLVKMYNLGPTGCGKALHLASWWKEKKTPFLKNENKISYTSNSIKDGEIG